MIDDWPRLPDQLVQALPRRRAAALVVNINSVCRARRLSIDQPAKFHGCSWCRATHDEMVARVKAVRDAAVFFSVEWSCSGLVCVCVCIAMDALPFDFDSCALVFKYCARLIGDAAWARSERTGLQK